MAPPHDQLKLEKYISPWGIDLIMALCRAGSGGWPGKEKFLWRVDGWHVSLPDDTVHTGRAFHHCAHACDVPSGTSEWSAYHIHHTQMASHLAQMEREYQEVYVAGTLF